MIGSYFKIILLFLSAVYCTIILQGAATTPFDFKYLLIGKSKISYLLPFLHSSIRHPHIWLLTNSFYN